MRNNIWLYSYDQYLCSLGWKTPSCPKMMNLLHNCDSTSLYIYVFWKKNGAKVAHVAFEKWWVWLCDHFNFSRHLYSFFPQFSFLFFSVEPEIQVDKVWVHADVSVEVEISCIVHAEPMAEVSNDTYEKCTLYQGYRNRYNLISCWHIFQQQRTISTGSRKKSWKVNWQKSETLFHKSHLVY